MSEILFRAKRLDTGAFEEGFFANGKYFLGEFGVRRAYILDPNHPMLAEVDPDTTGRYIGLTDINGKKIFEGDIVRHYNIDELPEEFEIGKIFFDKEQCCFKRTCNRSFSSYYISSDCKYEVIGNIHDNPELLKVPADG